MCSVLEPCTLWNEKPRTARRSHRCDCCRRTIRPGEAYLAHASLFEGEWTRERLCFACWWAREMYRAEPGHDLIPVPSALLEDLRECASSYSRHENSAMRSALAMVLVQRHGARIDGGADRG